MSLDEYRSFIASRAGTVQKSGFDHKPISPLAKTHQIAALQFAFDRGKSASFLDTGLGKSFIELEFARQCCEETGKNINDLSTVIYNGKITIENIPEEAYDYVVNGKPALEWVMERQAVTTDKKSGIINDANDWATEAMGNPRYPLELFLRVITVGLKTQKIVRSLPKLDIL